MGRFVSEVRSFFSEFGFGEEGTEEAAKTGKRSEKEEQMNLVVLFEIWTRDEETGARYTQYALFLVRVTDLEEMGRFVQWHGKVPRKEDAPAFLLDFLEKYAGSEIPKTGKPPEIGQPARVVHLGYERILLPEDVIQEPRARQSFATFVTETEY